MPTVKILDLLCHRCELLINSQMSAKLKTWAIVGSVKSWRYLLLEKKFKKQASLSHVRFKKPI